MPRNQHEYMVRVFKKSFRSPICSPVLPLVPLQLATIALHVAMAIIFLDWAAIDAGRSVCCALMTRALENEVYQLAYFDSDVNFSTNATNFSPIHSGTADASTSCAGFVDRSTASSNIVGTVKRATRVTATMCHISSSTAW